MEWYRQHSVTGQDLPPISPNEEEPSDQGAPCKPPWSKSLVASMSCRVGSLVACLHIGNTSLMHQHVKALQVLLCTNSCRSDTGSSTEGGRRTWWRRHSRGRSLGGASDAGAAPPLAANAGNYPHWAAFWERQCVTRSTPDMFHKARVVSGIN